MIELRLLPATAVALASGAFTPTPDPVPAPAPAPVVAAPTPVLIDGHGVVAVRAGTVHTVDAAGVLENGVILIEDGVIQAIGSDLAIPAAAHVVDYGPDAVIVPGFVAAYSTDAQGWPSKRTADPAVRAVDSFDPFGNYAHELAAGVTSIYITPSDQRLIAGQGAVVKVAGDEDTRVVNARAALHGAIDRSARSAPGYWEPPIPSTVDMGIGFEAPQLPKTTMGAIVALEELLAAGAAGDTGTEYGPRAPVDLAALLAAGTPLRLGASEPREILALLSFAKDAGVPVILDKATYAGDLAEEIAAAGLGVIYRVPYQGNQRSRSWGASPDARWPSFDVPAKLLAAGVEVAICGSDARDLLFSAALASRGGLTQDAALRSITLTPARLLGADARVGSLAPGKDADLVVLNGPPIGGGVLATWVSGEAAWEGGHGSSTVVLEVDELHVGDGEVLRPGQMLVLDGKIAEVGSAVSHPRGAKVVRGRAAMPGIVDAFGYLGLEGSGKVPSTDFPMTSIVAPGDELDRRVASHGITTVVMTPRGPSGSGAPVLAYKPAGEDLEHQVIADPAALRLRWSESDRMRSGTNVRGLLAKASAYRKKWAEYHEAMKSWTPPAPEPAAEEDDEKDEEEEDKEEEEEEKPKKKKKKRKKGEKEPLEPDPITGRWITQLEEGGSLKMWLSLVGGEGSEGPVEGNLRSSALSDTLVEIDGHFDREARTLDLTGRGNRGTVSLSFEIDEKKLVGKVGEEEVKIERISTEFVVAKRPERPAVKVEAPKPPKGKPKEPKRDAKLDPLVAAMEGSTAIVVEVNREDEIVECVKTFAAFGIRPVLYGADDAHYVVDEIADHVAGILPSPTVVARETKRGIEDRLPYTDLQNAGITVAFHSAAEEGAVDLPLRASYAVANGMSPVGALRALTADAARMMAIDHRVGRLARGLDADVLLLDGPPLAPGTSVLRTWVNGKEIHD